MICVQCGTEFEPIRVHKRFCSIICRNRDYYDRNLAERNRIKLEIKRKEREAMTATRPIHTIVGKVYLTDVPLAARPYLLALRHIDKISDQYHADSARSIVLYFLYNCQHWCGEQARQVKAELKTLLEARAETGAP